MTTKTLESELSFAEETFSLTEAESKIAALEAEVGRLHAALQKNAGAEMNAAHALVNGLTAERNRLAGQLVEMQAQRDDARKLVGESWSNPAVRVALAKWAAEAEVAT